MDNELWILDSGATSHMTYRRDFFSDIQKIDNDAVVFLGNGHELPVRGKGNIKIKKLLNNKLHHSAITDVMDVPNLDKNLFSEGVVAKKGMKIVKEGRNASLYENDVKIATAERVDNNLYHMQFNVRNVYGKTS